MLPLTALARGDSTFTLDGYSTDTADQMTNLSGVIYLNYECDFDGSPGKHPTTSMEVLTPWNALLQDRVVTDFVANFPEADCRGRARLVIGPAAATGGLDRAYPLDAYTR